MLNVPATTLGGLLLISGTVAAMQDPTRPTDPASYFGQAKTGKGNGWSLQSILSSPQRRIAIINGTRVREGERIGSAEVVSIEASYVVLNTGKRNLTLRLRPESIKVSP